MRRARCGRLFFLRRGQSQRSLALPLPGNARGARCALSGLGGGGWGGVAWPLGVAGFVLRRHGASARVPLSLTRAALDGRRPCLLLVSQIKVDDDGEIVDSCFKTFGCGSAIASSSVATEWIKGKSVEEASGVKNSDIAKELKLPPVKLHCSMLAEDAIKAAIADVKQKKAEREAKEAAE